MIENVHICFCFCNLKPQAWFQHLERAPLLVSAGMIRHVSNLVVYILISVGLFFFFRYLSPLSACWQAARLCGFEFVLLHHCAQVLWKGSVVPLQSVPPCSNNPLQHPTLRALDIVTCSSHPPHLAWLLAFPVLKLPIASYPRAGLLAWLTVVSITALLDRILMKNNAIQPLGPCSRHWTNNALCVFFNLHLIFIKICLGTLPYTFKTQSLKGNAPGPADYLEKWDSHLGLVSSEAYRPVNSTLKRMWKGLRANNEYSRSYNEYSRSYSFLVILLLDLLQFPWKAEYFPCSWNSNSIAVNPALPDSDLGSSLEVSTVAQG